MKNIRFFLILPITLTFIAGKLFAAGDENILRAMRDEIARSMKNLYVEKLEKPYYIEYKLTIDRMHYVKGTLGTITETDVYPSARLTVGVRVGDYKFDNTNFFDIGLSFFGSGDDEERFKDRPVPIEPDYESLRRELWLATDAAYKRNAEIFSKKEATIKNRMRKDTTHDFMKLPPAKNFAIEKIPEFGFEEKKNMVKSLSGIFRDYPEINMSSVGIEYIPETVYYVNSEGREYVKTEMFTGLEIVAVTQPKDGMPLADIFSAYSHEPGGLPSVDSLMSAANLLAVNLSGLSKAPVLQEPYSGPVLFEGQAAAELFAQVFAPNFITQRRRLTENGLQEGGRYSAFQMKIGGRVLPEFLSVAAAPEMKEYKGTVLSGHFTIDDFGIKPKHVNLVEDGYLKNLLSSRTPTRRVRETNGHTRGGSAMLSNIIVSSDDKHAVSDKRLKERMLELCKARELPYGLIVKKAMNQNILYTTLFRMTAGGYPNPRGEGKLPVLEIYKLYPDGREELVRGARTNGFTVQSFKDVILVGNENYAMNYLAPAVISPYISGGKQYVGASIIIPDLLFEDGEIRILEDDFPRPPLLDNPLSEN